MSFRVFYIITLIFVSVFLQVNATDWHVDNAATGANNGTSWTDAWQSFGDIVWGLVSPGDIVYISGGTTEKVYEEELSIGASGTENSFITVKVGQDAGHNGKVIIDLLNINPQRTERGIWIFSKSYVIVDGNYNNQQRIIIQNSANNGIYVYGDCHNIILKYLEVAFNGRAAYPSNGIHIQVLNPNYIHDSIIEIGHCKIHDNWQDQIFLNSPANPYYTEDYTEYLSFGKISVHHSEIYNFTDDAFVSSAGCADFYNNRVYNRINESRGVGHPDGLEFYGEYYRIYNNSFSNFISYGKVSNAYIGFHFGEGFYGPDLDPERPVHHVYITNNLFYEDILPYHITDPDYEFPVDYVRGIEFSMNSIRVHEVHNVLIANNHFINIPAWAMLIPLNPVTSSENISNFRVMNNVIYNCFTDGGGQVMVVTVNDTLTIGSANDAADIMIDYNLIHPGDNGTSLMGYKGNIMTFEEWRSHSGCENNGLNTNPMMDTIIFMPVSEESSLVNNGVDLSFLVDGHPELEFVQYDINGNLRPSGAWDIGVYEFMSATNITDYTSDKFRLFQNYPNPFVSNTTIDYYIPENSKVEISLYNLPGRKIQTLFQGYQNAGEHTLDVTLSNIPAGIYYYKLRCDNFSAIKKCIAVQ